MSKTYHMHNSMSRPEIRNSVLALSMKYGVRKKDKIILNRNGAKKLLKELGSMKKNVQKMLEKGGLAVIDVKGIQITTYCLKR